MGFAGCLLCKIDSMRYRDVISSHKHALVCDCVCVCLLALVHIQQYTQYTYNGAFHRTRRLTVNCERLYAVVLVFFIIIKLHILDIVKIDYLCAWRY